MKLLHMLKIKLSFNNTSQANMLGFSLKKRVYMIKLKRVVGDILKYQVEGTIYDVKIEKKNNKNTYIRIKPDNVIYVTTNYFVTNNQIKKLLEENYGALVRMHKKVMSKQVENSRFYYLGEVYDIIIVPTMKNVEVIENNIYTPNEKVLNKWLQKQCVILFQNRLDYYYNQMDEEIPYPKLKLRKMKTRWGVCNRRDYSVTLNTELIHYDKICLDYVVVHELSHYTHFNHSKEFWNLVGKYCSNYKEIRKKLKG